MQRAAREDHAILGLVHQFDALGGAGEHHGVFADHAATAQAAKPMSPALRAPVWPSRLVTLLLSSVMPRPSAAAWPEQQSGAGRRIDFLIVMHLENFDVERGIERLGHALGQRRQQIDAEAHIAGLDDLGRLGRVLDLAFVGGAQAGGADDVHLAGLGGERGHTPSVASGAVKSIMPSA